MSCVTKSAVKGWRCQRLTSSSCISMRVNESSAPKGSSIKSILGDMASTRAMATRCFMPPESWLGIALLESFETDELDEACDGLADGVFGVRMEFEAEGDVLLHCEPGEERIVLKDHAAAGTWRLHGCAVDSNASLFRLFETGGELQDRRLAAARGTEQANELLRGDRECDLLERKQLPRLLFEQVGLGYILKFDLHCNLYPCLRQHYF